MLAGLIRLGQHIQYIISNCNGWNWSYCRWFQQIWMTFESYSTGKCHIKSNISKLVVCRRDWWSLQPILFPHPNFSDEKPRIDNARGLFFSIIYIQGYPRINTNFNEKTAIDLLPMDWDGFSICDGCDGSSGIIPKQTIRSCWKPSCFRTRYYNIYDTYNYICNYLYLQLYIYIHTFDGGHVQLDSWVKLTKLGGGPDPSWGAWPWGLMGVITSPRMVQWCLVLDNAI